MWVALLSVALAAAAQAIELSGIILYDAYSADSPQTRAWHTSLDPAAQPMGVASYIPPGSFNLPLLNDSAGEVSVPLTTGGLFPVQVNCLFTAFWQVDPDRPLNNVAVSFFFNGDTLHPGISALVPVWPGAGFSYFRRNDAPTLLALYLREVENSADLQYTDGTSKVTLTALMISNAGPLLAGDRVGADSLAPDGALDTIAIIELTVVPDVPAPPPPRGPATGGLPPRVQWPLMPIVGPAVPGTSPGDQGKAPGGVSEREAAEAPAPAVSPQLDSTPDSSGTKDATAITTRSATTPSAKTPKRAAESGAQTPSPQATSAPTTPPPQLSTPRASDRKSPATTVMPGTTPTLSSEIPR